MFRQIFLFELKLWFKRPATYIFFSVFFLIAVLAICVMAGVIGSNNADSNTIFNSSWAVANYISRINTGFVGLVILITIIAPAVYKDFQYNMHPLLFTKPITKFGYIMGRFTASVAVALFVLTGSIFGHLLMCAIFSGDSARFGPINLMSYIEPFLLFVVPNTLLIGAIFFSLVTFSRNMIAGYVGCLALIILKNVTGALLQNLDNQTMAAIIEPFGEQALRNLTKYWSPEEQNTLSIPFEGVLLYNRLLWLSISIVIFAATFFRFRFSQFNEPISFFKRNRKTTMLSLASAPVQALSDIPKAKQVFTTSFSLYQTWFLAKFEFRKIVRSIFFLIVVVLASLSLIFVIPAYGEMYGTATHPHTYQILEVGGLLFRFFVHIIIIFYAGVTVWRERDSKVEELVGTAPLRPFVTFTSKFLALVMVQVVLLFVVMITGMLIQMYNGFYNVEPLLYIKDLFGLRLISLALICALCMSMQALINNRYVAYFVCILILMMPLAFELLGWSNSYVVYDSDGAQMPYSDMNGFGHTVYTYFIYKLYWASFAFILVLFSIMMWMRGKEKGFGSRLKIARTLFNRKTKLAFAFALVAFIFFGSFIYYNTAVLNKSISKDESEKQVAEFEKRYRKYLDTPQPRIVTANWNVDIFPNERGAKMKGYYTLKNKLNRNIDTIILNLNSKIKINSLVFSAANTAVLKDDVDGFHIYKLGSSLKPGDSIRLDIDLEYFPKGFTNDPETGIVFNGTFFNSSYLPSIGYNEAMELSEEKVRKKYQLPPKERMADVNDSLGRMNNYISNDADWINFECVMSTVPEQIAMAPGYLQREWTKDGRRYFHYKMDCKILNFYSFLSAEYEVKKDKWKDVSIEVYYHKGHEYNLDRMINAVKKSLDYYTANFSPYQHRQVRILEFPRFSAFAQSFPNTIPFSESIGFIAKIDPKNPESIDYPFYVTAHEIAHQWWAHQVIGGNVQGSTLMSETMSQYSALMVMEKEFGKQAMKKFLKYEMSKYLRGRASEGRKEMPLMYGENQMYIHYNKGSVIMYALRDYIGEDTLNAALRKYISKVAYQEPPYTNSVEFVNYLRDATPDSLKYIIHDMFETITLFENKTVKCSYTKTPEGKYMVKMDVECKKFRADSIGKLKDIKPADWIDIGVFGKEGKDGAEEKVLYLKKRKIDKEKMSFEILVDELPEKVGVDPYNKLIDRTPANNMKSLKDGNKKEESESGGVSISVGTKES
jgi:ABC-2 type transport system permease protein